MSKVTLHAGQACSINDSGDAICFQWWQAGQKGAAQGAAWAKILPTLLWWPGELRSNGFLMSPRSTAASDETSSHPSILPRSPTLAKPDQPQKQHIHVWKERMLSRRQVPGFTSVSMNMLPSVLRTPWLLHTLMLHRRQFPFCSCHHFSKCTQIHSPPQKFLSSFLKE